MYYLTGLPVEVTAAMDYPWAALLIIMFATANHHLEEREKRQRQQKRPATPLTPQQNLRAAMGLARDWFSTGAATSTVAAPTAVAATATVPATSTAAKRQKRSPEDELICQEDGSTNAKRRKRSPEDELICPLSLHLPWEPVTAGDGLVYEKEYIEKHIESKRGNLLRSPVKNVPMSRLLLPATHVKNLIEILIENGTITGELADAWNKKAQNQKDMADYVKRAEGGDADVMYKLAAAYTYARCGFKQDAKLAYKWCEKAHDAGNVMATALLGDMLLYGEGVTRCLSDGLMYVTMAAEQGSDLAAYILGMALADGTCGLSKNSEEAIRWLQKCLEDNCPHQHLRDLSKDRARNKLQELMNAEEDTE